MFHGAVTRGVAYNKALDSWYYGLAIQHLDVFRPVPIEADPSLAVWDSRPGLEWGISTAIRYVYRIDHDCHPVWIWKPFVRGPGNMVLLLILSAKNNPLTQKRIENVNPERLNSATNPAVRYRACCNRAKSAMPDGLWSETLWMKRGEDCRSVPRICRRVQPKYLNTKEEESLVRLRRTTRPNMIRCAGYLLTSGMSC